MATALRAAGETISLRVGLDAPPAALSAPAAPGADYSCRAPGDALITCPNCLTEADDDAYCSGCGRMLTARRAA